MARGEDREHRWLWYTPETADCVPLDRRAYPSKMFDGAPIPWPDWACTAPNGGVHQSAEREAIDVRVASPPNPTDELNWTCNFGVTVVAHSWLDQVSDLIDASRTFLGRLYVEERPLDGWSTLHERRPPTLVAAEGFTQTCPACGYASTVIYRGGYFSDPSVVGRPLIVNRSGLFVRADLAQSRKLRTPVGSFRPGVVRFRAGQA